MSLEGVSRDIPIVIEVGAGGEGGKNGQGGRDGEDTTLSFQHISGKLTTLTAKGGKGGGHPTQAELALSSTGRIRISSALLVNYAEIRDGLLYMLGGGWSFYPVYELPCIVQSNFVFVIDAEEVKVETRYELVFEVIDSNNKIAYQLPIIFDVTGLNLIQRKVLVVPFWGEASVLGIWLARVLSGDKELVQVSFEVRLAS